MWFFGANRRQNYASWWRGEISFEPELDELFAISHSKQGINPTVELREILTPDMEAVARQLNGRVQAAFAAVKYDEPPVFTTGTALKSERRAPAPGRPVPQPATNGRPAPAQSPANKPAEDNGQEYTVSVERLKSGVFFDAKVTGK
ncbi:MAG TPA: hypothetical protein VH682_25870 [Gemmataceae bacterium]